MQVCFVRGKVDNGQDQDEEEDREDSEALGYPGDDAVVPSEDGQLVQAGSKVPARSGVACNEYSKRDNGECVHAATHAVLGGCIHFPQDTQSGNHVIAKTLRQAVPSFSLAYSTLTPKRQAWLPASSTMGLNRSRCVQVSTRKSRPRELRLDGALVALIYSHGSYGKQSRCFVEPGYFSSASNLLPYQIS